MPPVPLLSHAYQCAFSHQNVHTLCPIRHTLFFIVRAYHFSKLFSSHLHLPMSAKLRKRVTLCLSEVESCRETWPSRRNLWGVNPGPRARMFIPRLNLFLHVEIQTNQPVAWIIESG